MNIAVRSSSGRHDRVIPFRNAEVLAAVTPDARLIEWSCGHNDCPPAGEELWDPLTEFLADAGLVREAPPPARR